MSVIINSLLLENIGKRRLKISDIARETGISRTTLTSLYYGKGKGITFDVMDKLCRYFSCDVGDIIHYQRDGEEVQ